jgi:carbonic anhydrase
MSKFDKYAFSASPSFDEAATRKAFSQAVPLKTLVIYCYDPRATEIPTAVADWLGGEVFPGKVVHDPSGHRIASTTTIFPVVVAGGRAVDALRSIAVAQHLFGIENVVVVHHSHCGATSFTADGIVDAFRHEHGADIAGLYDRGSICIEDYEASLRRDVALVRGHPGTPRQVNIYGLFYEIDSVQLTEVVRDMGVSLPPARTDADERPSATPRRAA